MAAWTVYVNGVPTYAGYPNTDELTLEKVSEWVSTTSGRLSWRLPGYDVDWDKNDDVAVAIATTNYAQFRYGWNAVVSLETEGMKMPPAARRLPSDLY